MCSKHRAHGPASDNGPAQFAHSPSTEHSFPPRRTIIRCIYSRDLQQRNTVFPYLVLYVLELSEAREVHGIFTKNHFDAEYEINVTQTSLEVVETGGSNMGSFGPLEGVIIATSALLLCGGVIFVAVIILVIILVIRNQRKKKAAAE